MERYRDCAGQSLCSYLECYFRNNFCSGAGLLCSIFERCNTCNETELLFLFTLYRISFFDALFHYQVQCEHSLSQLYPAQPCLGTVLIEQCSAPCLQMKIRNSTWTQVQRRNQRRKKQKETMWQLSEET